jgi:hypothetical protein
MDRNSLRLSAALLFVGVWLSVVAGLFHPAREDPNNHRAVFAEYASSADWTVIHFGQFAGMATITAGLVALFFAFGTQSEAVVWLGRFGAAAAVVSLALYGVLQAVDGVALKQAVDAWASAPEAEKTARFASAESMRWLEWAVRSYQSFMLGLSFLLLGAASAAQKRAFRGIGSLMVLSGLAYVVQCFVLGAEGFSAKNTIPQLSGSVSVLAWSTWLLIVAWRMKGLATAK